MRLEHWTPGVFEDKMSENYSDYDISGLGFGPQEESRVMAPLTQRFLGLPEEALSHPSPRDKRLC